MTTDAEIDAAEPVRASAAASISSPACHLSGRGVPRPASSGARLQPPAGVAGLQDIAVVCQPVEQRRGHLRVAEHARPLAKRQVRRHDHRGAFVESADQVEQHLSARPRERQVAQLVQDDEIGARQLRSDCGSGEGSECCRPICVGY